VPVRSAVRSLLARSRLGATASRAPSRRSRAPSGSPCRCRHRSTHAPWRPAYLGNERRPPSSTPASRNLLTNASFEHSSSGWYKNAFASASNLQQYNSAARSHDGNGFLEMNTSTAGGSIAQDVQVATNPGDSYAFSIWLRSPTGHPISGSVCLWGPGRYERERRDELHRRPPVDSGYGPA